MLSVPAAILAGGLVSYTIRLFGDHFWCGSGEFCPGEGTAVGFLLIPTMVGMAVCFRINLLSLGAIRARRGGQFASAARRAAIVSMVLSVAAFGFGAAVLVLI
jgi:hypothetical protein